MPEFFMPELLIKELCKKLAISASTYNFPDYTYKLLKKSFPASYFPTTLCYVMFKLCFCVCCEFTRKFLKYVS